MTSSFKLTAMAEQDLMMHREEIESHRAMGLLASDSAVEDVALVTYWYQRNPNMGYLFS